MYVCMYACMYVCMYVCMHVCVCAYVCMYVCMYVCIYIYIYIYVSRGYVSASLGRAEAMLAETVLADLRARAARVHQRKCMVSPGG